MFDLLTPFLTSSCCHGTAFEPGHLPSSAALFSYNRQDWRIHDPQSIANFKSLQAMSAISPFSYRSHTRGVTCYSTPTKPSQSQSFTLAESSCFCLWIFLSFLLVNGDKHLNPQDPLTPRLAQHGSHEAAPPRSRNASTRRRRREDRCYRWH